MSSLRKWNIVRFLAQRMPLVSQFPARVREMLVGAALIGAVLFLLFGGILGGLNRGAEGALIGSLSGVVCGAIFGGAAGAWLGGRYPQQQRQTTLALELDADNARRAPGETVNGNLVISAGDPLDIHTAGVYLLCRGFYAHDTAPSAQAGNPELARESVQYLIREMHIPLTQTIREGASRRYPFSFAIPTDAMPTHHGYLCAVHWTVHALVEAADLAPLKAQRELLIEASPNMLDIPSGGYQSVASAPSCQMTLSLPRAIYAEGEVVEGSVRLLPLEDLQATEVRAVLLRIEQTPVGFGHTVYVREWDPVSGLFQGERQPGGSGTTFVWLEDELLLSGPTLMSIAEPTSFPFKLDIANQWRPSLATAEGRATWKIGIVATFAAHGDIRAFHEVIVHTGVHVANMLKPDPAAHTHSATNR